MTTMQELARRWVWDDDEEALSEYCQREVARLDAEETMTNNSQPTPPLPDEVEAAIIDYFDTVMMLAQGRTNDANYEAALANLFAAIRTALAQAREDSSLRERAERLRRFVRAQLVLWDDHGTTLDAAYEALEADDLDDDLQPAQEVVGDG